LSSQETDTHRQNQPTRTSPRPGRLSMLPERARLANLGRRDLDLSVPQPLGKTLSRSLGIGLASPGPATGPQALVSVPPWGATK